MITQLKLICFCILGLGGFVLASGDEDQVVANMWKEISEEVQTGEEQVEPAKTFELLSHLKANLLDSDSVKAKLVQNYIQANEIRDDKCTDAYFELLEGLIAKSLHYPANLKPYIIDCRRRQFEICRPVLQRSLADAVSRFIVGDGKDSKMLIDAIFNGTEPSKDYLIICKTDKINFTEAVLTFMGQKLGPLNVKAYLNHGNGKENFVKMFHRTVDPACKKIMHEVHTFSTIYSKSSSYGDKTLVMDAIDPLTTEWLAYDCVCSSIYYNFKRITSEAHAVLKQRSKKKKKYFLGIIPYKQKRH